MGGEIGLEEEKMAVKGQGKKMVATIQEKKMVLIGKGKCAFGNRE